MEFCGPRFVFRGGSGNNAVGMKMILFACLVSVFVATAAPAFGEDADPLAIGVAAHAFDHLGGIPDQAPAAAASGMTIIYASGIGSLGYSGLPSADALKTANAVSADYINKAKASGIRLAIAYVCATSIVKLETFDSNWTPDFRSQFSAPPAKWLQQDRDGKPLPSWYGGDYRPACMNNPDWRKYEKFMVRQQLEAGHDGIFFDNPTVHPQGCYCEHCMKKFATFLEHEGAKDLPATDATPALRQLAVSRPKDFMRFRCTIAPDFLAEIRAYARTIKSGALITCNNSLNSAEVLFSQCQTYGYNIHAMSRVEDLVVIEDMAGQPRVLADGTVVEYGPVYEILHAISHDKPVVAVTLADADYHTPPNLTCLAMAEAAAHGASYLAWPTWPENARSKMIAAVRPAADFLRENAELLNGTIPRADAVVFLPYRRWVDAADCRELQTVRMLGRANVQFRVVCEEDLEKSVAADSSPALIVESPEVMTEPERLAVAKFKDKGGAVIWSNHVNWIADLPNKKTIKLTAPPTVRAVVREKGKKTIVHLLNLNVQKLSSFEDRITPASNVKLHVRSASEHPTAVKALTADADASQGSLEFKITAEKDAAFVDVTVPRVGISTIVVIE
jgi:hypothetical protein